MENYNDTMPKLLIISFLFLTSVSVAQRDYGEVIGTIVDNNGYPQMDAHIYIDIFGQRYQAKSDLDGRFRISMIPPGEYLMNVRIFNDTLKGIPMEVPLDGFHNSGEIVFEANIKLSNCPPYHPSPMIPMPIFHQVKIERDDFKLNVNRFDLPTYIDGVSSEIQTNQLGDLNIRGGDKDMLILVDGIKLRGNLTLPSSGIQSITIDTGGIPAKYGDTTSGVIKIETRSYFDVYRE